MLFIYLFIYLIIFFNRAASSCADFFSAYFHFILGNAHGLPFGVFVVRFFLALVGFASSPSMPTNTRPNISSTPVAEDASTRSLAHECASLVTYAVRPLFLPMEKSKPDKYAGNSSKGIPSIAYLLHTTANSVGSMRHSNARGALFVLALP